MRRDRGDGTSEEVAGDLMGPAEITKLVRALIIVGALLAVWFGGKAVIGFIQAPKQVELNATRANNAAFKAAAEKSNTGVTQDKKASDEKAARTQAAVAVAGKPEFEKAKSIQDKAAPGATPLERAANRINSEFGQ